MKLRIVEMVYPCSSNSIETAIIPILKTHKTIYDTVDLFEQYILKSKIKKSVKDVKNKVLLRDIINLHNSDGIKILSQIKSMVKQIEKGKDVFSKHKYPNIKLVKTKNNELVLFDGHHSMLAYMFAGKEYLNEIPHLIIKEKGGYLSDKEIHVFFGKHSTKLKNKDWRDYVINWELPEEKQLCKRIQSNMGELFKAMKKEISL